MSSTKLTPKQRIDIAKLLQADVRQFIIAKKYKVTYTCVHRIQLKLLGRLDKGK